MRAPRPLVLVLAGALLSSCARGGDPHAVTNSNRPLTPSPTARPRPRHATSPLHDPLIPVRPFHLDQHQAIRDALAFIRRRVSVPVVLPPNLPLGLRLAMDHPVYRVSSRPPGYVLVLDWSGNGEFLFQFGAAVFDGCGALFAHPIEIRGHPALINGPEVIWPATPSHPTGKYGVRGPLPPREIVALAESMPVLTDHGDRGNC
jgi:hypothetical protein